jgi:Beta-glucosidase-related glycosidases
MSWNVSDEDLAALVDQMSVDEKVVLLSGDGLWRSAANYRLNIPELIMTDGTYGVRYSTDQIDGVLDDQDQFSQFFGVVNAGQDNSGQESGEDTFDQMFGSSKAATCFPNGSSFACAWDVDLAYELGQALARECQAFGVHLLLGPGINIRRTPLAGRGYEYYSEDPILTADLAAGVIKGLQDAGVGAALKHFACNNSEVQRTTMSSDVSERALREIYLKGFERTIAKSDPWVVMSSYNRLNGVQAAEDPWLLTEVLREDWGYEGVVVSDWHGIKDRAAALRAGNDLDMPQSAPRMADLTAAITCGGVAMEAVDRACLRMLKLVRKGRNGIRPDATVDFDAHHRLARRMAADSVVLLKNDETILPLEVAGQKIAVIGGNALSPVIQGSGCATTRPTEVDVPLEELMALAGEGSTILYLPSGTEAEIAEALETAATCDAVLFFGTTEIGYDGEGSDRAHLNLAEGQDALIVRVAAINPRTIVALSVPDAVEMPWIDDVAAVLVSFFPGQGGGHGLAQVLFGEQTPCGKLTVTFPKRLKDTPGHLTYPGENGRHAYSEGIFVGYRSYDARDIEPLFPFGFGLSYTEFAYSDLTTDASSYGAGETVTLRFTVTNTGPRAGKEIVQLYARPTSPRLHRPVRELKAFEKVTLAPGESTEVTLTLGVDELRYYDDLIGAWLNDEGVTVLEIGASSRDIRLSAEVDLNTGSIPETPLTVDSQPYLILDDAARRAAFRDFLQARLDLDQVEADKLLDYCATSFLGIYNTLSWIIEDRIPRADMAEFLGTLNQPTGAKPAP